MPKYGFNENEIVATKTVQIDKDGFHRVVDGTNSEIDGIPLPTLYVYKDSEHDDNINITINAYIMYGIAKSEVVYGTGADDSYPMKTIVVFSNNSIDFSELPTNSNLGHVFELLENKNVHYVIVQSNYERNIDTSLFKNATTDMAISAVFGHSEAPSFDDIGTNHSNAGYSWFLNANKNDSIQIYTFFLNRDDNSMYIKKFGNFLWPYEKSISYNPDGALKASPANGEFNSVTGVTLNLEGTGKYCADTHEIFISQTGFTGTITDLSSCCSILSTRDNTSQNITSANGFNTIDGTVTISGGFVEGENTLYVYGCTKDASDNWVIKESATVEFNYVGNVI